MDTLPPGTLLTSHIHSLTRIIISHIRDLHLILQGLKPKKTIFYSRFEFRRCFAQLISREEVRIWRCELLFERWLSDELNTIIYKNCDGLLSLVNGTNQNSQFDSTTIQSNGISVLERYAHPLPGDNLQDNQLFYHEEQFIQPNEIIQSTSSQIVEKAKESLQNITQLINTQEDHKIFLSIVNTIFDLLRSENHILQSMKSLFIFMYSLRKEYLKEIHDVFNHFQRIKLRKNDDRDVYKCVFSYAIEDQGVDNEVLYDLKHELKTAYLNPLEVLIEESQATLNNMLLQVQTRIQDEYRIRLQSLSVTIEENNNKNSTNKENNDNKSIDLEFTEDFIKSRYTSQILELLRQNQNEYDDDFNFTEDIKQDTQFELSKIKSRDAQKSSVDVQNWIQKQYFWKKMMLQLHQIRQKEIQEHKIYMDQYFKKLTSQRNDYERILKSNNTKVIQRWKAAITIQCFIRRMNAIKLRNRKENAIYLLQRIFRIYIAKKKLRVLRDQQFLDHDSRAQVALWRRRQDLYYATEKHDSQIIMGHLMLRKEFEDVENKIFEEQKQFNEHWESFVKKVQRDMLKGPLKPEWTEHLDPITGKKLFMNVITGHEQHEHPNYKNFKNYITTEEKRHKESFDHRLSKLQDYMDQINHLEVTQRVELLKVYDEALKEFTQITFN